MGTKCGTPEEGGKEGGKDSFVSISICLQEVLIVLKHQTKPNEYMVQTSSGSLGQTEEAWSLEGPGWKSIRRRRA